MDYHATLMRYAVSTTDATVLALAGLISAALDETGEHILFIRGLATDEARWLLVRWFPGVDRALPLEFGAAAVDSQSGSCDDDEFEDLVTLFKSHADPSAGTTIEVHCISNVLACACLKEEHLWQALRLPSRRELSALLGHWFPRLAEKNVLGMKWKKFFYKQLCEREGWFVCKVPICSDCRDFADCFGPE
ncbi:nitrogen fixation protein NifQ [Cupriavidus consociatus]|uniref:nitrogen fixation protein NifQ n=1 Tax=Cupriavidus consociatus TaxID=2821357 RepID=UPI001AE6DD76|nr:MULTISPECIES: nitrogen fixation protein NifQ [unclassified Cupriavidus]MBP0625404.1 nitrogen fixation protein NifQ [Cupriavidus sp. LEh25]MDK2662146.1 nitrogen fixation protein NifQ [Cupriavidus sp. LEh21]